MIVQCNRCLTKFKISDDKVRGKIVRIRCAKCHQPFTVQGEDVPEKKTASPSNEVINNNNDDSRVMAQAEAPASDNTNNEAAFSLNESEDNLDAGLNESTPASNADKDNNDIGGGLSIDQPLGEEQTSAPESFNPEPFNEETDTAPAPSVEKEEDASAQGFSLELNTDSSSVDNTEAPKDDSPAEDFALDTDEEDDNDEPEFTPAPAAPEEIIEDDDNDNGELDLGIGTGVVTISEDNDSDNTAAPSLEDTLADSGFGFSEGNSETDIEEPDFDFEDSPEDDLTEDIDEFPDVPETEDLEFGAELPDFDNEPQEEPLLGSDSTEDAVSAEAAEPFDDTTDDLTQEAAPDTAADDFGIAQTKDADEEVFKGFADEPSCEEPQEAAPMREEPTHEEPAIEEDSTPNNIEPPLLFETPVSPRPEITFTPAPPVAASPESSAPKVSKDNASREKKSGGSRWLSLIILAAVIYGGIGLLYSGGHIGPPKSAEAELSPIRVERIRGVFIENKEMGRIFAIEGRIRNFSEEPQGIRMIRGVLENKLGRVIAAKKVTPGKIISKETLKTITKAKLLKQLSGVPGGSIPPKGSIPVMIIFTKPPKGFTRASVEVFRR